MIKVNKVEKPEFLIQFNKKNKPKNWKDFNNEIKNKLKEYMAKNEQNINGNYFCPCCEREIMIEKSQIEHIRPKDKFPNLFNEYSNFLVGCLENHTCGSAKGNKWNELFINSVENNPEEYFEYDIKTGKIVPKHKTGKKNERAIKTIEILNLNEKKLCEIRKVMIVEILKGGKENIKYIRKFPTLKIFLENSFNR